MAAGGRSRGSGLSRGASAFYYLTVSARDSPGQLATGANTGGTVAGVASGAGADDAIRMSDGVCSGAPSVLTSWEDYQERRREERVTMLPPPTIALAGGCTTATSLEHHAAGMMGHFEVAW